MFVTSLRYVCDVTAMPETGRFLNWSYKYFRKQLFYLSKSICSQFYCLLSYNIHYLEHIQHLLANNETTYVGHQNM